MSNSARTTKSNVIGIFQSYLRAAANIGYDVSEWNIKITTGPLIINASQGPTGPAAFTPLPGFASITLGITYKDVYAALMTATRTYQSMAVDRPGRSARPLYRYTVGGRYGTYYVDLYYDIDRNGKYTENSETCLFEGSRKKMEEIAKSLNAALRHDPIQPKHNDPLMRYTTK